MKGIDQEFGSRLRFVRERWKLTQNGLATRAAVTLATISCNSSAIRWLKRIATSTTGSVDPITTVPSG